MTRVGVPHLLPPPSSAAGRRRVFDVRARAHGPRCRRAQRRPRRRRGPPGAGDAELGGAAWPRRGVFHLRSLPPPPAPPRQMTQWQGLVTSCVAFPELLNTTGLLALAVAELDALLQDGVYPGACPPSQGCRRCWQAGAGAALLAPSRPADGVETEMASGYDMGTAGDFYGTLQLLADAGLPPPSAAFRSHVEQMWDYGAPRRGCPVTTCGWAPRALECLGAGSYISDPAGCLPRNGDSDLCGSGYLGSVTQYFGRPDWTYVRTNGAQVGGRWEGRCCPGDPLCSARSSARIRGKLLIAGHAAADLQDPGPIERVSVVGPGGAMRRSHSPHFGIHWPPVAPPPPTDCSPLRVQRQRDVGVVRRRPVRLLRPRAPRQAYAERPRPRLYAARRLGALRVPGEWRAASSRRPESSRSRCRERTSATRCTASMRRSRVRTTRGRSTAATSCPSPVRARGRRRSCDL